MVVFDGSEPCGRAEEYYHDYLSDENDPSIPQAVADHIPQCPYCQRRLERLRAMLSEIESDETAIPCPEDAALVAELQAHFELLGEPLGCSRVKPFLPSLLVASLKIKVPTPVTVHVDQCPDCARDLESLRALGLDTEQLDRLGHLYADGANGGFWTCLRTLSKIGVMRSGALERMDAETLDHLCVCPRCRNWLYQQRQRLLGQGGEDEVCCADITAADLFDFVVPYGGPAGAAENGRSERCREHLRTCLDCLERVQQLHRTIYGILDRPDSDVITVCEARSDAPAEAELVESLYDAYPIDVQVLNREPEPAGGAASRHRLRTHLRPVFKPALMAAAMIPLAVIFLFMVPAASGLSGRQVNKILRDTPTVHVLIYGGDLTEPKQQLWACQADRLFIVERASGREVHEFGLGRSSFIRNVEGGGLVRETGAPDAAVAERVMGNLLGLSPAFQDRPWQRLDGSSVPVPVEPGVEVYELRGRGRSAAGAERFYQWIFHVDSETGLPRKMEFSRRDSLEEDFVPDETRCFEYPSAAQVRQRADDLLPLE